MLVGLGGVFCCEDVIYFGLWVLVGYFNIKLVGLLMDNEGIDVVVFVGVCV